LKSAFQLDHFHLGRSLEQKTTLSAVSANSSVRYYVLEEPPLAISRKASCKGPCAL
jgi:hypothetical protein